MKIVHKNVSRTNKSSQHYAHFAQNGVKREESQKSQIKINRAQINHRNAMHIMHKMISHASSHRNDTLK